MSVKIKTSPAWHKNITRRNNWWLNVTQSLYLSFSLFNSRPNNAEKSTSRYLLSDHRLFYLFNTMNLFVLRALDSTQLSTYKTTERTFSIYFSSVVFFCALIFLLLVFTTTCWSKILRFAFLSLFHLFSFFTSLER